MAKDQAAARTPTPTEQPGVTNVTPPSVAARRSAVMQATVAFQVSADYEARLLEVVYPAEPSPGDVAAYTTRTKALIESFRGPWDCLVDQRQLVAIPARVVGHITSLNAYAAQNGMRRCARVVTSAVSTMQAHRIAQEAALGQSVRTFATREQALAWLRSSSEPGARGG
jgi:hypothetical protein